MLLSLGLTTGLFVLKREIWARQILEFDKFSLKIGMLGQKKNTQRSSYPSQIDEEFLSLMLLSCCISCCRMMLLSLRAV